MKYIVMSALIILNITLCAAEFPAANSADAEQGALILSKWESSLRKADHEYIEDMQSRLSRNAQAITVIQEIHENKALADYYTQMKNRMATIKVEPNGTVKSGGDFIPRISTIIRMEEEKLEALKRAGLDINPNRANAIKILCIEETVVGDDIRMFQAAIAAELHRATWYGCVDEFKSAYIESTQEKIAQRLEIVNRVENELWVEVPLPVPQVEEEPLKPGEKRKDNAEIFETSKWVRRSELKS